MGDTQERDLVAQLQRRADMIADAHARKSGKKVERPFTLEDCAIAEISRLRAELASHEAVHASHRKLVRELDVILNGEENAAPQASLCDLIPKIRTLQRRGAISARARIIGALHEFSPGPIEEYTDLGVLADSILASLTADGPILCARAAAPAAEKVTDHG